jgi:hypothetical protein
MRRRVREQNFSMINKEENMNNLYTKQFVPKKEIEQELSGNPSRNLIYQVLENGKDAVFHSGINKGKRISELSQTTEGRDFLGGLWKLGKRDLQNVIKQYFSD